MKSSQTRNICPAPNSESNLVATSTVDPLPEIDAALYGSFLDDKVDSDGAPRNIISPCKQTRYQGRGRRSRSSNQGCRMRSGWNFLRIKSRHGVLPGQPRDRSSSRNTILTKDPSTGTTQILRECRRCLCSARCKPSIALSRSALTDRTAPTPNLATRDFRT